MKLIKDLGMRKDSNNCTQRWGLFLCEYCNREIEKRLRNGKECYSCGCMQVKLRIKHGDTVNQKITKLYTIHRNMIARCYNKNDTKYKDYGGRGIKICKQWKNSYIIFKIFAIAHGYKDGLTIDRINNDGNYEPGNCKFSTRKEQAHNRRNNKLTLKKANQIRSLYFNIKIKQILLAKIFKIHKSIISLIIKNKIW